VFIKGSRKPAADLLGLPAAGQFAGAEVYAGSAHADRVNKIGN